MNHNFYEIEWDERGRVLQICFLSVLLSQAMHFFIKSTFPFPEGQKGRIQYVHVSVQRILFPLKTERLQGFKYLCTFSLFLFCQCFFYHFSNFYSSCISLLIILFFKQLLL